MRMPVDDASVCRAVEQAGGSSQQVEADLVRHRAMIVRQLERHRLQAFGLGLEGTPSYLIGVSWLRAPCPSANFYAPSPRLVLRTAGADGDEPLSCVRCIRLP